ncbi:hypothetical protein FOA52_009181 [Chlamydomonas sp. UWO 241]|nr:hypothetical protein FOA52_009181 [Chlamydomonas sp. UWO 241]
MPAMMPSLMDQLKDMPDDLPLGALQLSDAGGSPVDNNPAPPPRGSLLDHPSGHAPTPSHAHMRNSASSHSSMVMTNSTTMGMLSSSDLSEVAAAVAHQHHQGGLHQGGGDGSRDAPPVGCDHDAIKLFVGNINRSLNEGDLLPLFDTIGRVVELVIVRDRVTRESKGSAFLWYATRENAEQAVLQLNLRLTLPDSTGLPGRPMVLRRAQARARAPPPMIMQSAPMMSMGSGSMGMGGGRSGMPALNHHTQPGMGIGGYGSGMHGGFGSAGMAFPGGMGMPIVPLGYPGVDDTVQAVSIPLSRHHTNSVVDNLHHVSSITGTSVSVTHAQLPGSFHIVIKGPAVQVQAATDLFGSHCFPKPRGMLHA